MFTGEGARMVVTTKREVQTRGQGDGHDITTLVANVLSESALTAGTATVFVTGSTAGVTTIEFEAGAVADFNALFDRLAPRRADYQHHLRWQDDNGSSHVRAALLGPSLTIPFERGQLLLGTWQQVLLIEFDTRPRRREIVIQLHGE
jgi:secondary thiamine-phosphate synthase enzyme